MLFSVLTGAVSTAVWIVVCRSAVTKMVKFIWQCRAITELSSFAKFHHAMIKPLMSNGLCLWNMFCNVNQKFRMVFCHCSCFVSFVNCIISKLTLYWLWNVLFVFPDQVLRYYLSFLLCFPKWWPLYFPPSAWSLSSGKGIFTWELIIRPVNE